MIIDTSALIAVVRAEAEAERLLATMLAARQPRISTASLVECWIVADGRGPVVSRRLDALIRDLLIEPVPVTLEHAQVARAAYRDFGKGSGHPARLNFGDCFSYALASLTGEPLLFIGDDFVHTDIRSALGDPPEGQPRS